MYAASECAMICISSKKFCHTKHEAICQLEGRGSEYVSTHSPRDTAPFIARETNSELQYCKYVHNFININRFETNGKQREIAPTTTTEKKQNTENTCNDNAIMQNGVARLDNNRKVCVLCVAHWLWLNCMHRIGLTLSGAADRRSGRVWRGWCRNQNIEAITWAFNCVYILFAAPFQVWDSVWHVTGHVASHVNHMHSFSMQQIAQNVFNKARSVCLCRSPLVCRLNYILKLFPLHITLETISDYIVCVCVCVCRRCSSHVYRPPIPVACEIYPHKPTHTCTNARIQCKHCIGRTQSVQSNVYYGLVLWIHVTPNAVQWSLMVVQCSVCVCVGWLR